MQDCFWLCLGSCFGRVTHSLGMTTGIDHALLSGKNGEFLRTQRSLRWQGRKEDKVASARRYKGPKCVKRELWTVVRRPISLDSSGRAIYPDQHSSAAGQLDVAFGCGQGYLAGRFRPSGVRDRDAVAKTVDAARAW